MKKILPIIAAICGAAQAGTIFLPGYPDRILVIDEATHEIVDRIPSQIGIPTGLNKSYDRKKLYVSSNDNDGIEVFDIATHKVLDHFVLNTPTHKFRINGVAPDPQDKLLYTMVREVTKQVDRYQIDKLKYAEIDIARHKIVRTADMLPEDQEANNSYYGGSPFHVSPDGKYLYQFRDKVVILDTGDFHVVDRIDLAKPDFPDFAEIGLQGSFDTLDERGAVISLFNAEDPVVHWWADAVLL